MHSQDTSSRDFIIELLFQREEDEVTLQMGTILEEDADGDLVDLLQMKSIRYVHTATTSVQSGSEMKEIYDTDHEVEEEKEQHRRHYALPSYVESGSENKEEDETEFAVPTESVHRDMQSRGVNDFTFISMMPMSSR